MPTFPVYPGELPSCLNPLNPRHYFLLVYWVFFRPTALKCYLYAANPELYQAKQQDVRILRTLLEPAYRNCFLVALGATILVVILLAIPSGLLATAIHITNTDFSSVTRGAALGLAKGLALSVTFGITLGLILNVAVGMTFGVTSGLTFCAAYGVAGGLTGGLTKGLLYDTALGIFAGLAFSATGAGFLVLDLGVALGLFVGLVFSLVFTMIKSVGYGAVGGIALCLGALRLPIYLLEIGGLLGFPYNKRHPIWWDELAVIPYLRIRAALNEEWTYEETPALIKTAHLVANPFQRWAIQRTFYHRLHKSSSELSFLYLLFQVTDLDTYVSPPVLKSDWQIIPSTRQVLVSEIAGFGYMHARNQEGRVWWVTKPLRIQKETPLTEFAQLLYKLTWEFDQSESIPDDFDLNHYRSLFSRLADYVGGPEIQQSFAYMAEFLNYASLAEISTAPACLGNLPHSDNAIRPPVIQALQQFGRIGQDVAVFQVATSRLNQLAALGRATDALEDLREYINETVLPPEKVLLQDIVRRWRSLVSDEIGKLGKIAIAEPVPNPYVAGNPVSGDLFVGREEILRELEELWLKPGQVDSVLLYGHRRMGKSSILKNLHNRLDPQRNWVVEFNLQRVGKVSSTGELLYALALSLYDRIPPNANVSIEEPSEAAFLDEGRNPRRAFDRWLKTLESHMENRRFIVAIDEFELIESAIDDGRVDADLTEFLRGIIQTTDWFVLALAGLYTLQEKCYDYWNPLFGSIKPRKVSFLSPASTRSLITQPSPDFPLDYTEETIEEIIRLTNGQPYLVQLIGQNLVARFNHRVFEAGEAPDRPISIEDLQAVIESPEFFQDGGAYFTGVWGQAEDSDPEGQTKVLEVLCQDTKTLAEISADTGLSPQQVEAALETLKSHDVVRVSENVVYTFTVELMRRWVQQRLA
jgi:hypothetical protein